MKKRSVSSNADRRAGEPPLAQESATSLSGSSSSFQVRISAGIDRLSATDGRSKNGVTMIGSPCAGMTAAVSRSERHHWTPVK